MCPAVVKGVYQLLLLKALTSWHCARPLAVVQHTKLIRLKPLEDPVKQPLKMLLQVYAVLIMCLSRDEMQPLDHMHVCRQQGCPADQMQAGKAALLGHQACRGGVGWCQVQPCCHCSLPPPPDGADTSLDQT